MKIKTSDLIGPALDWAVAKCEGAIPDETAHGEMWLRFPKAREENKPEFRLMTLLNYSTDWLQGGPIIDREKIALHPAGNDWSADINCNYQQYGPTPLIAAMRCYVASKLGDEVEIPEELLS